MVAPIVLYEYNTKHNRLGDFFLSRLNYICGDNYTLKDI